MDHSHSCCIERVKIITLMDVTLDVALCGMTFFFLRSAPSAIASEIVGPPLRLILSIYHVAGSPRADV